MAGKSNIEWTEQTWNPIVGCSILSPGCTNCYAMKMAARIEAMKSSHYDGTTKRVNGNAVWTGKLALAPDHIVLEPLRRKKPTTYFVNSMGDLFHETAPDEAILKVLDVIRRTSYDGGSNCGTIKGEHTYQVLTKRAARMTSFMPRLRFNPRDDRGLYLADDGKPSVVMKNLWLGVSAERQQEADERIPLLLQTPAAVRFVSAEPLLGPISFRWAKWDNWKNPDGSRRSEVDQHDGLRMLDWIIVGGESGPNARNFHLEWAVAIVEQCRAASVPCFVKQLGAAPMFADYPMEMKSRKGGDPSEWPDSLKVRAMPKVVA